MIFGTDIKCVCGHDHGGHRIEEPHLCLVRDCPCVGYVRDEEAYAKALEAEPEEPEVCEFVKCAGGKVFVSLGNWCEHGRESTCLQGRYVVHVPCPECNRSEYLSQLKDMMERLGPCTRYEIIRGLARLLLPEHVIEDRRHL